MSASQASLAPPDNTPPPPARACACSIEPGCVRLRCDTALPPRDAPDGSPASALNNAALLACAAAALASPGAAGAFFAQSAWSVARGSVVVTHTPSGAGPGMPGLLTVAEAAPATAALPPLAPLALCSARRGALAFAGGAAAPCRGRFHGAWLVAADCSRVGSSGAIRVPATRLTGVALFEPADIPHGGVVPHPRPVLLTPDAAIAAEVAGLHAGHPKSEALVRALGHALRPGAPVALVAAAAADAACKKWPATLRALLALLREAALEAGCDAAAEAEADAGADLGAGDSKFEVAETALLAAKATCVLPGTDTTLLHVAAAGGCPACCKAVLGFGGPEALFGSPLSVRFDGQTPLHAAAAASKEAASLLLRAGGAEAAALWAAATDASGRTPRDRADALAAAAAAEADAFRASRLRVGVARAKMSLIFMTVLHVACFLRRKLPAVPLAESIVDGIPSWHLCLMHACYPASDGIPGGVHQLWFAAFAACLLMPQLLGTRARDAAVAINIFIAGA